MMQDDLNSNRAVWDQLVPIHLHSRFYDLQGFRVGRCSLKKPELELVESPRDKKLLHLQCHFGLDSLSWASLGAIVTGVDFSPVAIESASRLAASLGIEARFSCCDVHELYGFSGFDLAISTYGTMCWIGDLHRWAAGICRSLRPGGRFVLVDFHPVLEILFPGKMTGASGYFGSREGHRTVTKGTYAERDAPIEYTEIRWQHALCSIAGALTEAGLQLRIFREYPFCSYPLFDDLLESEDGVWRPAPALAGRVPYMFSFVWEKP